MITNLLDNARIGTADKVHVRVYAAEGTAALLCLEVSDSGPGVPTADRERIFERFLPLDTARSQNTGGSGARANHQPGCHTRSRRSPDLPATGGLPGARFVVTLPRSAPEPLTSLDLGPAGSACRRDELHERSRDVDELADRHRLVRSVRLADVARAV